MSDESPPAQPPRSHSADKRLCRWRRRLAHACTAVLAVGLMLSALAWLLPLRIAADSRAYDVWFSIAFFSRVFLLPVACGFAGLAGTAGACRAWRTAATSLLMALAWAAPEVWLARPHPAAPAVAAGQPTFSIASFNLNKNLADASNAIAFVRAWDADYVLFQELSPRIAEQLEAALSEAYPHRLVFPDKGFNGMAIFSRSPLALEHAPSGNADRDLSALATAIGRPFLLENVHLAPPRPADRRALNRRQVRRLIDEAAARTIPAILVGDFNFTTFSPQGSILADSGFVDAHRRVGGGRQATWPARGSGERVPASVRIDNVFTTGGDIFTPVDTEVGPAFGSDHLPIKVTFR